MNYGFNLPKGTWMISMKVNNDEIWNKVKLGEIKGFSIEGYFADKYEMSLVNEDDILMNKIKEIILAEGQTHYTIDGKIWSGETHKDENGRLMTGAEHTEDSKLLYHAI
jgi:hypothetical protein